MKHEIVKDKKNVLQSNYQFYLVIFFKENKVSF